MTDHIDRRALLRLALGAAAGLGLRDARAPRALRLVLVGDDAPGDALAFGAAEATRSAAPFGLRVTFERAAEPAADGDAALVLFGGTDAASCAAVAERARALGALYVDAWCGLGPHGATGCGAWVVRVAPNAAMRVAALAAAGPKALGATAWRVEADDAARRVGLHDLARRALTAAGATVGDTGAATLAIGERIEARGTDDARLEAVAWHPSLEAFGAAQLGARFRQAASRDMDERAWAAWAGAKLAVEGALRAAAGESIARRVARSDFVLDAHKGAPLFVRPDDRQLVQPLYVVRAGDAARVIATVPPLGPEARGALFEFGFANLCGRPA